MTRLILTLLLLAPLSSIADPAIPDSRTWLPSQWDNNLRFSIDVSSRQIYSDASEDWYRVDFIGTDLHKVFTGDNGDIGTLTLQGYFTHFKDDEIRPGFADGEWTYVYRIFNFNYHLLSRGRMNLKVGHFEIPMGLEHSINTNGTLRDYTHGRNIGVKADWGVSLNGILRNAEYEFSLTRGSGNSYKTDGDPYIAAGRVSTPSHRNLVLGVSAMAGDVYVYNSGGQTIERERVGADVQWYFNQFGLLGEVSVGERDGQDTSTSLVELNRTANSGTWMAYAQLVRTTIESLSGPEQDSSTVFVGAKWDLERWDVSFQVGHDLDSFDNNSEKNLYVVQARYRF